MMDLFGLLCTMVGAGTLSMWVMRIVIQLDEGAKKDRTRREAGYGHSAK